MITVFPSAFNALYKMALVVVFPLVPMVTIVFSRIWEAMTLKILGSINLATYPGRVTPLPRFNFLIRALVPFAHVIASLLLNFIVIHYHPFL